MFKAFAQIFRDPDLRRKILITAGLLVVSRIFASVPIPGANQERLQFLFSQSQFLGLLNIFSGGALSNFSIAMLGVNPYITATIILQLLTMIFPNLKEMYYEAGEAGRAQFNQYARYLTVGLALIQGVGFLNFLRVQGVFAPASQFDLLRNVIIIAAGSVLLMWLGELISEQKMGNGSSLIIFAGIIAGLPVSLRNSLITFDATKIPAYLLLLVIILVTLAGVVLINESERRIPVNYAKRVRGMKLYGGASSYLPLKVNQAGVIPIIFALSVMLLPGMAAQLLQLTKNPALMAVATHLQALTNNQVGYAIAYFLLVFAFTYFYTIITFEPKEIANNLQKQGGFIPGIRPGAATAQFLSHTLYRITFLGALFLGIIAILPNIAQGATGISTIRFGGTTILIVVSVAIESIRQVRAQLLMREYDTF